MKTLPKLKLLNDVDSYKMWYHTTAVDSDHPTYLVVKLSYTEEWGDQPEFKYHVEVLAVGPDWPTEKNLQDNLDSYGVSLEDYQKFPSEGKIEFLADCGLSACLWQGSGNNQRELIKAAKEEISKISLLFGFYMDRPQNRLGATGWDWIKGDVLGSLGQKDE